MCGIGGILGAADAGLVRGMMEGLAHRGPDGTGVHEDEGATLGHRRLAIIDRAMGRQPMTDHGGRFTIAYNGEVYNHGALRAELEAAGHRFGTRSDTEVILEGWKAWGPGLLPRIEGMFAFALWDTTERVLHLARDLWGQKPLHYAWVDGCLLWASEAKAFAAHPAFHFALDPAMLRLQAVLEFLPAEATLMQGVRQLPPGSCASVPLAGLAALRGRALPATAIQRPDPVQPPGPDAAAKRLAEAIRHSVAQQLQAEVPVATVLSGGLDSSIVATVHQAVARETGGRAVTVTVAGDEAVPDLQAARQVAQALGTEHHEATFTAGELAAWLPAHVAHQENVSHPEAFFFPLFARLRVHGAVALCGQGADELWGGYSRYRDPASLWAERRARADRVGVDIAAWAPAHASGEALARSDQGDQLASFQLRLVDRASMAHAVEARSPLLSRPIQALSDGAPWAWKLHGGANTGGANTGGANTGGASTGGAGTGRPGTGPGNGPSAAGRPAVDKWVLRKAARLLGVPRVATERPKLPAGRATAPGAIAGVEAMAASWLGDRWTSHPLAACFQHPAEALMLEVWREVFEVRRGDARGVALDGVAASWRPRPVAQGAPQARAARRE